MSTTVGEATVGEFIAERGRRSTVRAGQPLFFEGDRSDSVYCCVDGCIRLYVSTDSGREILIGFKHPGEHFGELSAITHRPRVASACAAEDSMIARLPGDRFLAELGREHGLAFSVLLSLADQLRAANLRLLARNAESCSARTGHKLAELAALRRRHGETDRSTSIVLDLTQNDLASWIGTSRESVCRALGEFRRLGVVETGRCHITVHDLEGLVRAADDR